MINSLLGDRYKLGEMIGTGGMADVYVAEDTRLARQVAVKVLRSDLARDPSFVARFRKEALAAAALNHPGIVAVYDSGEEPAPYIVMELISGHTLRDLIHKGERVPLKRALEIGEGILAALEYSHHSGIVHRDIKPANIMITDNGDVKVMDFGIARALADLGATLTSTWNVVGTAQYLSPEQALGEVADLRSDIYSTGCLLYEVLTGKPPFTGETPVSIAYQHVSGVLALPSSIVPGLPAGIDTLLTVEQKIMNVNFWATVSLSKAILPKMIAQGNGNLVVISSLVGKFGTQFRSTYAASKHALHGYFDSLRNEVFDKGISVHIICPGFIKTNITINSVTSNGGVYGKMDQNQEDGMSAQNCAIKILNAIAKNKEEVLIGGKETYGVYIKRLFPKYFSKMIRKRKVV